MSKNQSSTKDVAIIAYSGHAYVVCSVLESMGRSVKFYTDLQEKGNNPFNLQYLGREDDESTLDILCNLDYFVCIGNNRVRAKVSNQVANSFTKEPIHAIHTRSVIHDSVLIKNGVLVCANVTINPLSIIEDGVICNTGCIIEHENKIGKYAHIGPGAILCGNVDVGEYSFIGAGAVVRQGLKIGANVTIGAGAVVTKNVPDNQVWVGVPAKKITNS